jgi:beta-glucosidase-like glycosyl hydrolase
MKCHRGTTWLGLGVALGASLGAATGEMGLWLAIGAGIGGGLMSLAYGLDERRNQRCGRMDEPGSSDG